MSGNWQWGTVDAGIEAPSAGILELPKGSAFWKME